MSTVNWTFRKYKKEMIWCCSSQVYILFSYECLLTHLILCSWRENLRFFCSFLTEHVYLFSWYEFVMGWLLILITKSSQYKLDWGGYDNNNNSVTRLGCFGVTAMLSWGWLKLRLIDVDVDWSWGWLKLRLIKVEVDWSWGWLELRLIEVKVNLCYNLWYVFEVSSYRLITFILFDFLS